MNICQVVSSVNADTGGPAYTVTRLADELSNLGHQASIVTLHYPKLGKQLSPQHAELVTCPINFLSHAFRGFSFAYSRLLFERANHAEIIHSHGLWMGPNYFARRAAAVKQIPLVISPRGMLEPWSLQFRSLKKRIAYSLFESSNLRLASAFHATSKAECATIRSLGYTQPVCIIPNGIDTHVGEVGQRDGLECDFPLLEGKRWLLFMSRIHPKKGVSELLQVWKDLHDTYPDWHLVIAGSDILNMRPQLEDFVQHTNMSEAVSFVGHLEGRKKQIALRHSDLFVLPSYSENFGVVVAEALFFKTPVLVTTAMPWQEVVQNECGWTMEPGKGALHDTLEQALAVERVQLDQMGEKGAAWVRQEYDWSRIGNEMSSFYNWLIGSGDKPQCVSLD